MLEVGILCLQTVGSIIGLWLNGDMVLDSEGTTVSVLIWVIFCWVIYFFVRFLKDLVYKRG